MKPVEEILTRTTFTETGGLNLARAKEIAEAIDAASSDAGIGRKINTVKALRLVAAAAYAAGRAATDPVNASATIDLIYEDLGEIRSMLHTLLKVS